MSQLESFKALGLSGETLEALNKKGFEAPSSIQEKVIPLLLQGDKDVVGQSHTGSGKTAAFGLPIIERIQPRSGSVQALILTPTRELTLQVAEELISLKGSKKLTILPVYGGQSIEMQLKHLKRGVDIVVGTPGRLLDHIRRKSLKLSALSFCILDEADEMLNMGFLEDVQKILDQTPDEKRTLLFSATMPKEILDIAETYMGEYELIKIQKQQLTVSETDQIYFQVRESDKFEALCRIIDIEDVFYGLVFCRTKIDADRIAGGLINRGYDADALHGDLSQAQREKVMDKFRKQVINILVATDVAARGIDVNDLTHVINFALPQDPESYVHRIGRTGRAGKEGTAITFITPSEERKLLFIQKKTKSTIRREQVPEVYDIVEAKKARIESDLLSIIHSNGYMNQMAWAQSLLKVESPEALLAAFLSYAFEEELDPSNYNVIRDAQPHIPGQTRLFIARGRKDGMTPQKLIRLINEKVNVNPQKIKDILIQENFSFMNVPFREAELILKEFQKRKPGKKALVEKAAPRDGKDSGKGR